MKINFQKGHSGSSECIVCTQNLSVSNRRRCHPANFSARERRALCFPFVLSGYLYFNILLLLRLAKDGKDVKTMLTHKIRRQVFISSAEVEARLVQGEQINKNKITVNEVSSHKYLIGEFVRLYQHI